MQGQPCEFYLARGQVAYAVKIQGRAFSARRPPHPHAVRWAELHACPGPPSLLRTLPGAFTRPWSVPFLYY